MAFLYKKNIVIAISASIAAYKIPYLVRFLKKEGAFIKVIMTPSSRDFVSALTLSTLSKQEVWFDFYNPSTCSWNNYVELSLWADLLIVAPASANLISKMALGICDNIVLATYLSFKSEKVFFAPAMDLDMYEHPAVRENIDKLSKRGNILIDAKKGELASGLIGFGRMAEPFEIVEELKSYFSSYARLKGKKVLISAGATEEKIDPVRYISNYSSAKMGFELAKVAYNMGAEVILVHGTKKGHFILEDAIDQIEISSAREMKKELETHFHWSDILIMSAAVADYRVKEVSKEKIKKQEDTFSLNLVKNPDILACLSKKKNHQFMVGFALETHDEKRNALKKLNEKDLDLIVLNSLNDKGAGFNTDTNKVRLFSKKGKEIKIPLKRKKEVAFDILNFIAEEISKK